MPKYKIKAPDGRTVTISGSKPPSEVEMNQIFAELPPVTGMPPEKQIKLDSLKTEAEELATKRDEFIQKAQKEGFQEQPWYDRLAAGAGAVATKTMRGLASGQQYPYKGMPHGNINYPAEQAAAEESLKAYERASEGDIAAGAGEVGADLALLAVPGGKAAKIGKLAKGATGAMLGGLGAGAASAGQHQLQNIGAGKDVSKAEAGVELVLSAILPGIGEKTGEVLKKTAPGVLRSAVKPPRGLMGSKNPPKFDEPLKQKLVTRMGGLEKAQKNTEKVVKDLAEKRDALVREANVEINVTQAVQQTKNRLTKMAQRSEIDFNDYKKAKKQADNALKTARKKTSAVKKGDQIFVSGEDATELRKLADKGSKWSAALNVTPPPKSIFNESYRGAIEDGMTKQLKSGSVKTASDYKKLKKGMADLIPFEKSVASRLEQLGNNYRLGLMDFGALSVGSGLGAAGGYQSDQGIGKGALAGAGGIFALRRLTSTPGGARMLYDMGQRLSVPSTLKNLLMQSARSGAFQSRQGE